jgi:hypothetical protein
MSQLAVANRVLSGPPVYQLDAEHSPQWRSQNTTIQKSCYEVETHVWIKLLTTVFFRFANTAAHEIYPCDVGEAQRKTFGGTRGHNAAFIHSIMPCTRTRFNVSDPHQLHSYRAIYWKRSPGKSHLEGNRFLNS